MNRLKNAAKYSLYILLPLFFFGLVHLIFAYAIWEIDPSKWHDLTRGFCAFVGITASLASILLVKEFIEVIEKH